LSGSEFGEAAQIVSHVINAGDRADFDAFDDAESIACPHSAKTLPAKPSVPVEDVRRLKEEGLNPTQISKQLKIGRASVYRALAA